jgi:hypothetical protein
MQTEVVPLPTTQDLQTFLGWYFDTELESQAAAHLDRARRIVYRYTRGQGFYAYPSAMCAADIAEVIKGLAGRSLNNPLDAVRIESGSYNSMPGLGQLSLSDRLTLDEYRRKAA